MLLNYTVASAGAKRSRLMSIQRANVWPVGAVTAP